MSSQPVEIPPWLLPKHPHNFGLVPNFNNIPQSIRGGLWCAWAAKPRKGKPGKFDKIPSNGLYNISTKDTGHWLTFDEAKQLYEQNSDRFNGVGKLVQIDDGLTFLDYDSIPNTRELAESLNTYSELSPSGNGVRAIALGAPSKDITKPIEIYGGHAPRFVTITGNILNSRGVGPIPDVIDGYILQATKSSAKPLKQNVPELLPGVIVPEHLEHLAEVPAKETTDRSGELFKNSILLIKNGMTPVEVLSWLSTTEWVEMAEDHWELHPLEYLWRTIEKADATVREERAAELGLFNTLQDRANALSPGQTEEAKTLVQDVVSAGVDPVEEEGLLTTIKQQTGVSMGALRRGATAARRSVADPDLTHMEMAHAYIASLHEPKPVGVFGKLWRYVQDQGIWEPVDLKRIGSEIASRFNDEALCKRKSDYQAIASLVYDQLTDDEFFTNALKGICTSDGFIGVKDKQVVGWSHSPDHRARFKVTATPDYDRQPERLLLALRQAFKGHHTEEQIRQLQQHAGLAIMGMQAPEQICEFLYGVGGSFKSGFQKVMQALVPPESIAVVSPLDMDQDYKKASLAGKLINMVPELSKDSPIPSADFKSITGGDRISCREPFGMPFSFIADSGNWFNSNYFITTTDHSDAFWRRWAIIYFANGTRPEQRIKDLDKIIIQEELPQVLGWVLRGVADYLANGLYLSPEHYAQMDIWCVNSNSVAAWLHDTEDSGVKVLVGVTEPNTFIKVKTAYSTYRNWCTTVNRRPYGKPQWKGHMADLGHVATTRDGYSVINGIMTQVLP